MTSDRVDMCITKVREILFKRMFLANKNDNFCQEFWNVLSVNKKCLHGVDLSVCKTMDAAILKNDLL